MHKLNKFLLTIVGLFVLGAVEYAAIGTPSNLVVKTDANNYLLVTSVTQTNPVTQGVFTSRVLRTDSNGSLQVVLTGTVTPTYPMSIPASTCAAPSLGEAGAATTGIAFTSTPSVLTCVGGTGVLTVAAGSVTSTQPFVGPLGSQTATGLNFGTAGTGIFAANANGIGIAINGTRYIQVAANELDITSDTATLFMGASADLAATRQAANWWFQRNGTSAQRASWANTYTSSTNYEAFSVDWQTTANVALVGTRTAATGTGRPLRLSAQASSSTNEYITLNLDRNAASGSFATLGIVNAALSDAASTLTGNWFVLGTGIDTRTSGSAVRGAITPTYNQSSGTAANTDLLVNRTQTAVGSGTQLLLDLQVGNSTKFRIDNTGSLSYLGILADSTIAPTIASGGCTSPAITHSNGTVAFLITIGTSCTGVKTVVLTMPASAHFWACQGNNNTSDAQQITNYIVARATSTTAVTLTSYDRVTGLQEDFTASDTYLMQCRAE